MPKEEPWNEDEQLNYIGDIVVGLLVLECAGPDLRQEKLAAIRTRTYAPEPAKRSITSLVNDYAHYQVVIMELLLASLAEYKHRIYNNKYQAEIAALAGAAQILLTKIESREEGDPTPRKSAINLARTAFDFFAAYAHARDIVIAADIVDLIDELIGPRVGTNPRPHDHHHAPPILAMFRREFLEEAVPKILQQRAAPGRSGPRVHQHRAEGRGRTFIA